MLMMRAVFLLGLIALADPALAQTSTTRTVIAAGKLPSVTETPLHFRVVTVTLPAGVRSLASGANGALYQISGSTIATLDGSARTLVAGEGLLVTAGKTADLQAASGGPSVFLHFMLEPSELMDKPAQAAPASARELYRTATPIPDLKSGAYDINLTRITFPAGMPLNAPHHRSGAALYYVISGSGANVIGTETFARGPGSFIYEPYGLVHRWGNPGDTPLTFITFNINPEGVAAVVPDPAAKTE